MQPKESGKRSVRIQGDAVSPAISGNPEKVHRRLVRYSSKPTVALSSALPAHEALRRIHWALLRVILHNREGVLRSRDPEFLHDFRVAVRRARSALTQVKGVFPAANTERIKTALSSMTRVTGPARDLDVFLEKLEVYESGLPERIRRNLVPFKELARRWRRDQQPVLEKALESVPWAEAVERWEAFLVQGTGPRTLPPKGRRPIGAVASKRIRKAYHRVARRESLAGLETESLHRIRIDCKKLRYLLEFFRSLYPARVAAPLIKSLKSLQAVLGDVHDLVVHQELARSLWTDIHPRPESPVALEGLERRLTQLQAQAHEATEERFRRFCAEATPW